MMSIILAFSICIVICAGVFLSWRDRKIIAGWIILLGSLALFIGIPFLNTLIFGLTESVNVYVTFIIILIFLVCVRLIRSWFCKSRILKIRSYGK